MAEDIQIRLRHQPHTPQGGTVQHRLDVSPGKNGVVAAGKDLLAEDNGVKLAVGVCMGGMEDIGGDNGPVAALQQHSAARRGQLNAAPLHI